ncbi:hypothetical protein [Variovorax sp. YR216]|uniref:hypothetical protein n=1 Tax=Variovorax sp. YR216 TaxID=1882828 RepID=UPI000B85652D|nr:hypothetical protein [Variovorax sp. YR216]
MAIALVIFACFPASARTQSSIAGFSVSTSAKGAETEAELLGSAIYSPYSNGAPAKQKRPPLASTPRSERDPDLTMTLAASAGGAFALAWLLRRI